MPVDRFGGDSLMVCVAMHYSGNTNQLNCDKMNTECTALQFTLCCFAIHSQKQSVCLSAGQCSAKNISSLR